MLNNLHEAQKIRDGLTTEEAAEFDELIGGLRLPDISLHDFVRDLWPVVEPHTKFIDNWHIGAITEHLEAQTWGQIPNLIINIQPRHAKSLLVAVFWQAWAWTFRPSSRWIFYSYSGEFATRDNVRARRIMSSPLYRERWGHVWKFAGDQNVKTKYENDQGGAREAAGVGGSTGSGADHLVGDDLLSIQNRTSETKREDANDFWSTTVGTRKNHSRATETIIAQRLHEHDIVGYLEEKAEEGAAPYELLVIPTEYDGNKYVTSIGWSDPRTEPGELLWPARFDHKSIEQLKKTLGQDQSSAQLQQNPTPAGGNVFKLKYWKMWQPPGAELPVIRFHDQDGRHVAFPLVEAPTQYDIICQSWDMNFKKVAGASMVAGQVWGKKDANIFLLDQVVGEMGIVDTIEALQDMVKTWPQTSAIWIEDKANGPAVIDLMKNRIPGLIPIEPKGDKETRANAAVPFAEAGNIHIPHPQLASWLWDYIDELGKFPYALHDDQVDATTQAVIRFFLSQPEKKPAGTWGRNRKKKVKA